MAVVQQMQRWSDLQPHSLAGAARAAAAACRYQNLVYVHSLTAAEVVAEGGSLSLKLTGLNCDESV